MSQELEGIETSLPADQVEGVEAAAENEVDTLRAELAAERTKAADAEARYRAAAAERDTTRGHLTESVTSQFAAHEQAIDARISVADFNLRQAKAEFVAAQQEGRFAEAADIAEKIADAKLSARDAAAEKARLAQARQQAESQPQPPADPVDRMLASVQSDASRRWLQTNRSVAEQMATDPRYLARVTAADSEAYGNGIDRDTPEYFAFIESKLGLRAEPAAEPAAPARQRSTATAAAAPARRAPAGASQAGREISLDDVVRRLTPEMRMAAKTSFPHASEDEALKSYARGIVLSKQRDSSYLPNFKL